MLFLGRSFGSLVAATLIVAATGLGAVAQESFDPSALDTKGDPAQGAKAKGKKAAHQKEAAPAAKPAKPGASGDRQFGELEGWSPGKAPPKDKADEPAANDSKKGPVSVSPSGNMSVGLPF
jgi:hypothetical protein